MYIYIHMEYPFEVAERVASLALKPRKCEIVPLAPWSECIKEAVGQWIAASIPRWAYFDVVPQAAYLGVLLGLVVGDSVRDSAISKFEGRVKLISSVGPPAEVSVHLFSSRVF